MKVYIEPNYTEPDKADGGIRRVVDAMRKHLPSFGIEVVDSPNEADLINCHAMSFVDAPDKPLVHSNHGMYWEELNWPDAFRYYNQEIAEIMVRANAITCPSNWVKMALDRGMLKEKYTVYHGVDADDWKHSYNNLGYILWNKARADVVSNPGDMQRLAAMMPDTPFVSTLGSVAQNVQITGTVPYEEMKRMIQQAGLYLATARETFGIGTLEALAAGVPVVGWNWGGQQEIIKHGVTGLLAEPGNYDELAEYIELALDNRDFYSKNAVEDVLERWQWKDKIQQYAQIFHSTYRNYYNVLV